MSSIYKEKGIYYLQVTINYKSIKRSLRTKDKRTAKRRAKELEQQLYSELLNPNKTRFVPFNELIKKYLKANHDWSPSTREKVTSLLKKYKKNVPLPKNEATKTTVKEKHNCVINWGIRNDFVTDVSKYTNLKKKPSRTRVFSDIELVKIFKHVKDDNFRRFVHFAYFTGARRGELCHMVEHRIYDKYFKTHGKSGYRLVRLNKQARDVLLQQGGIWDYLESYVTHTFKKNLRRIGIKDGRFHDLRRTFGLNLIKAGMPIFQVSKLLGHKSVKTTEDHYAPLLITDIDNFTFKVKN